MQECSKQKIKIYTLFGEKEMGPNDEDVLLIKTDCLGICNGKRIMVIQE